MAQQQRTPTTFQKAIREEVGLLIAFVGSSGSGKTYSALRCGSGIVAASDGRMALIDTENGRGKHYADFFDYDYTQITEPFRPQTYVDAILDADKAGYKVIVVDSVSHVWNGPGGVTDWHEEELDKLAGDNWQKREAMKMLAWSKPKVAHKQMVQRLLQVKAHLILCFRAEEKIKMVEVEEDGRKKNKPTPIGWMPICDKNLPYEMTISALLTDEHPGIPEKFYKRQEQHKALFPDGNLIDETCGRRIAEWAKGNPGGTGSITTQMDAAMQVVVLIGKIANCKSYDELRSLNGAINNAKAQLSAEQNEELKQAWQARARELKPVDPAPTTSQPPSQEEALITLVREKMRDDNVSQEDMDNLIGAVVGAVKPLEELIAAELNDVLAAMTQ